MQQAIDVNRGNFDEFVLRGSAARPVLVDFWAPWCGPCRALAPVLNEIAVEFDGRLTLAKLNTDEEPELAGVWGVRGIPSCKLFVDGRVVDEFTGVLPAPAIRAFLARSLPSMATPLIANAKSRLLEGDAAGALEAVDQALAIDADDEDALLTKTESLLAAGRGIEASAIAATIESPQRLRARPLRDAARLSTLRARAALAAGRSDDLCALARRAAATPADPQAMLDYANALAAAGDYERALGELLAIVAAHRAHGNDAGRRAMLTIFEALGANSDLARRYRRELATIINR